MTAGDEHLDFAVECAAHLNRVDSHGFGWIHYLPHDAALRPGGVWLRGVWMSRREDGWELRPRFGGPTVVVRPAVSTQRKAAA